MRLFAYIYSFLTVIVLTCCSNNTTQKTDTNQQAASQLSAHQTGEDNIYELPAEPYKVNIGKALKEAKTINLSEYCDSIEYVPLETRPDFYMGDITTNNCVIYNDLIYYKGPGGSGSKIFDINGKLVSDRIGTEGRAYGEHTLMTNLFVNEFTKELVGRDSRIMIYDSVGKFKREIPFKDKIPAKGSMVGWGYAHPLNQYYIFNSLYVDTKEYVLTILNSNGEFVSSNKLGKLPDGLSIYRTHPLFFSLQNGLLHIMDIMSDTVFTYNHNLEKKPSYIMNYGRYKISKQAAENDQFFFVNHILENKKIAIFMGRIQQRTVPYLLNTNNLVYLVFDKQNGTCRVLAPDKYRKWFAFNNDIDGGLPFNPVIIKGDKMFQFVDAYNFIKYSKGCSSPKVKEIAASLTEDSNHVMVIAHFKTNQKHRF